MSPRTLRHAPPADQELDGFGLDRRAYDNATTARSRRLVDLSVRAESSAVAADAVASRVTGLFGLLDVPAATEADRLRRRRDHCRRRAHALWVAALACDPVLASRYR